MRGGGWVHGFVVRRHGEIRRTSQLDDELRHALLHLGAFHLEDRGCGSCSTAMGIGRHHPKLRQFERAQFDFDFGQLVRQPILLRRRHLTILGNPLLTRPELR